MDLLYFYHSGNVYCARDFAAIAKIPRCGACDELIFALEYTGAEDKVWHLKHFCCWECDRPLAGHKYISVDGQPHCLHCYQTKHGKVSYKIKRNLKVLENSYQRCYSYSSCVKRAANTSTPKTSGCCWIRSTGTLDPNAFVAPCVENRCWAKRWPASTA